jgi:cytochrome P450
VALTEGMLKGWKDCDIIDVHCEMMTLTLRVAAKTLFDSDVEQDISDIEHATVDLIRELKSRFRRPILIPDWVPLPGHLRYRRAIRSVERVVGRMIAERRRTGLDGRTDLLSRMMTATADGGQAMSDERLRDHMVTLLLAGHETTALTLSWALHLIGSNRQVQSRLAAELDSVLGGRSVTVADLPMLKYAEAVILEAMRLYPPAWVIGRESLGPFEIGGYAFGPKTTVYISQWVLHRDPRYYAEPEAFRPERWMDGRLAKELPRFAYMPFGGGPRICIGQRFAMIEAVMLLATIAQTFAVEWQQDRPITLNPSITLRPEGGVWVRLTARGPSRTVH